MYNTSQNYKDKVLIDSTQHELNIYIDGNKVDSNHIIDFKQTIELFNNSEFCLGCTPEIDIEFEIDKRDLPETYNEVYVETGVDDEIAPIGYFTIQKPIEDNEFKVKIKATDYMKKFEDNKYDGSDLTYPQTMLQVLQDICKKIGVELGSTSFLNSDKQIAVYDNTVSARTYLGYIAEQAGGIAVIGRDGKLYLRQIGQDVINFDINLFKDYKWGDKFKISKVSYEDGIQDYKFGDETADTVYIDQNNMYIVNSEQVENIYNQIKDFEIYSFEGETIIDPAYDIGDILVIDGKQVLYQGELEYAGKFKANIKSKIQAKTEQESMQTKENNTTKIRRVESRIDQAEGKITQLVKETTALEKTTVKTVQVQYALSDSTTTAPTSGWSTTAPQWESGKYMWQRTVTTYSDDTTKTSKPTCIQGAKGETGADGKDGTNGKDGANGKDGTNGKDGADGKSIGDIINYYLATSLSSGVTTSTSGWSTTVQSISSSKKYLWNYEVIKYTDGTTASTSTPCVIGVYGDKGTTGATGAKGDKGDTGATGKGISKITEKYAVSSSNTTAPTTWYDTVQTMTNTNKYLWNYEIITYTDNTTSTTAKRVIGVYGDKGATGSTGATGATGAKGDKGDTGATGKGIESVQDQYYLSTSNTSQAGGSWKNSQDTWEEGKYYWIRSLITWTDNTVTYTEPILAEGINNANESIETVKTSVAEQNIEIGSIKQTVSETQTMTANNYNELKTKFDDYAPKSDIITIQNSVEKIQTDTYTKTEINTKLTDGSVTKVQTTAGTFGEDGLTIEKTNAKTKGKFNEKGMQVVDATGSSEEILLFAGYDEATDETIVKSKNMTVEKYLVVGANCRFEDYENPALGGKGTGVFSL